MRAQFDTGELEIDRKARLRIPAARLDYRPTAERIMDFDEACLGFSIEAAQKEASRCVECPEPQGCVLACPLNNDIPSAMWEISQGNLLAAAAIFRETSNFPELCGRLCPDEFLCSGSCGVGKFHPDIRLGRLEAFACDHQRSVEGGIPIPEMRPATGKRVAVVGSGPAGLTAAEELAKFGHTITVFELHSNIGGTLICDIPRFRLPQAIVDDKVAQLERMGVEFVHNTYIGRDLSVDDLFKRGYLAIFLGTGAGFEHDMELLELNHLEGVYRATEFLAHINLSEDPLTTREHLPEVDKQRIAIFGCGYSAVDCARAAVRLGAAEVTCFYRGCELDTLCRIEDKIAAQEEGVDFVPLIMPVQLIGNEKGWVTEIQCQRMRPSGLGLKEVPVPIKGALFTIDADLVILASERGPDPTLPNATRDLEIEPGGWIHVEPETSQTTRRGVFAAGDNTGQSQLAVIAIAEARKAASAIHDFLTNDEGAL